MGVGLLAMTSNSSRFPTRETRPSPTHWLVCMSFIVMCAFTSALDRPVDPVPQPGVTTILTRSILDETRVEELGVTSNDLLQLDPLLANDEDYSGLVEHDGTLGRHVELSFQWTTDNCAYYPTAIELMGPSGLYQTRGIHVEIPEPENVKPGDWRSVQVIITPDDYPPGLKEKPIPWLHMQRLVIYRSGHKTIPKAEANIGMKFKNMKITKRIAAPIRPSAEGKIPLLPVRNLEVDWSSGKEFFVHPPVPVDEYKPWETFSISLWIRFQGEPSGHERYIITEAFLGGTHTPEIYLRPKDYHVGVMISTLSTFRGGIDKSQRPLLPHLWQHVGLVITPYSMRLYIDGEIDTIFTLNNEPLMKNSLLALGGIPGKNNTWLPSTFSAVDIYHRGLTDREMKSLGSDYLRVVMKDDESEMLMAGRDASERLMKLQNTDLSLMKEGDNTLGDVTVHFDLYTNNVRFKLNYLTITSSADRGVGHETGIKTEIPKPASGKWEKGWNHVRFIIPRSDYIHKGYTPTWSKTDIVEFHRSGPDVKSEDGVIMLLRALVLEKDWCPNNCSGHGRCFHGQCQCAPAYTGADCSEPACPNECTYNGLCHDGVCQCFDGWTGHECSTRSHCNGAGAPLTSAGNATSNSHHVTYLSGDGCSGHGTCRHDQCDCEDGYAGDDCSKPLCPNDCSGHGKCDGDNEHCLCGDGWRGEDCSVYPKCPNGCSGHGDCDYMRGCLCEPGFTGADCSEEVCEKGCSGRGECRNGECHCNQGWKGWSCDIPSCPAECHWRAACVNGTCVCGPGWTGHECEIPVCPNGCSGHGECPHGRDCVCHPGWTGLDCSMQLCPNNCSGTGKCDRGVCYCPPNWGGLDCSISPLCPDMCNDKGICNVQLGKCECDPGWYGANCSNRACPGAVAGGVMCSGHGRCHQGKCHCSNGWYGSECSKISCPKNCSNHGECVGGKCKCAPGWKGALCDQDDCPNQCSGDNGHCNPEGSCECNPGWETRDCSVRSCPMNCYEHLDRGRCRNSTCHCKDGWEGADCGQYLCPKNCTSEANGVCVGGKCHCQDGWRGDDCGHKICPNNCGGHGECRVNGSCACFDAWTGEDCSQPVCSDPECGGHRHGQCKDNRCYCHWDWTGTRCTEKACHNDCHLRGRCVDGKCHCNKGWWGRDCSFDRPPFLMYWAQCIRQCHVKCLPQCFNQTGWWKHPFDGELFHDPQMVSTSYRASHPPQVVHPKAEYYQLPVERDSYKEMFSKWKGPLGSKEETERPPLPPGAEVLLERMHELSDRGPSNPSSRNIPEKPLGLRTFSENR